MEAKDVRYMSIEQPDLKAEVEFLPGGGAPGCVVVIERLKGNELRVCVSHSQRDGGSTWTEDTMVVVLGKGSE